MTKGIVWMLSLLILAHVSLGHVWTGEWLNTTGCGPCTTNVTTSNVYAPCYLSGKMCQSDQATLFQNSTNSLPEYLVPVYDLTCTNNQPVSFLGHIQLVYSQTQLMVLGHFPELMQYYDCHTGEWLRIIQGVGNTFQTIRLDMAPNSLLVTGVAVINSSNAFQFMSVGSVPFDRTLVLMANWSVALSSNWMNQTANRWFFSADSTVTVFSNRTQTTRKITFSLAGGTTLISCNDSLIHDAATCTVLNRQMRAFARPTVLPITLPLWKLSDEFWSVPLREQCEQVHAYNSTSISINQIRAQTADSRAQLVTQPFACVNPFVRIVTNTSNEWANLFPIVVTILDTPSPIGVPSPTLSTPTPSGVPSPTPSELSNLTATPPPGEEPPKSSLTMPIIILIIVLAILVLGILIASVGVGVIRQHCQARLRQDAEEGNVISINRASWLYTLCCINLKKISFIDNVYGFSYDDETKTINDEQQIILSESEKTPRSPNDIPPETKVDQEFKQAYLTSISEELGSEDSLQLTRRVTKPALKKDRTEEEDDDSLFM